MAHPKRPSKSDALLWKQPPHIVYASDQLAHEALRSCARFGEPVHRILDKVPIYGISLPRDSARRAALAASAPGVDVIWCDGIRAAQAPVDTDTTVQLPYCRTIHGVEFVLPVGSKPMTYGELGCTIAHLLAIKQIAERTKQWSLVIEDDVRFDPVPFWPTTLTDYLASAPEWADLVQLGTNARELELTGERYRRHQPGENHLSGTHCYAVRKRGAARLWTDRTKRFVFPVDHALYVNGMITCTFLFNRLATAHNLAFPAVTHSDGTSRIGSLFGCLPTSTRVAHATLERLLARLVQDHPGSVPATLVVPGTVAISSKGMVDVDTLTKSIEGTAIRLFVLPAHVADRPKTTATPQLKPPPPSRHKRITSRFRRS